VSEARQKRSGGDLTTEGEGTKATDQGWPSSPRSPRWKPKEAGSRGEKGSRKKKQGLHSGKWVIARWTKRAEEKSELTLDMSSKQGGKRRGGTCGQKGTDLNWWHIVKSSALSPVLNRLIGEERKRIRLPIQK